MSAHVVAWVLDHSPATLGSRLVLIVLAEHAGPDGRNAYPSVNTIARRARLSRRSVQYALRELENLGCITLTHRRDGGTNVYRVNTDIGKFDELPPLNDSSPKSLNGSIDGLGAMGCAPPRANSAPAQDLRTPVLRVVRGA